MTYPRKLTGVVRKEDGRRKATREAQAQRKATAAVAEQEQVKRVKSVKRRELEARSAVVPCVVPSCFYTWTAPAQATQNDAAIAKNVLAYSGLDVC